MDLITIHCSAAFSIPKKVYVRTGIYSSLGRRIEAIAELNELAHKDTTRV